MANDSTDTPKDSSITQPPQFKGKVAPPPKKGEQGALETVVLRNEFYRDSMHWVLILTIILSLVIAILCSFIFYRESTRDPVLYFATDAKGSLIPMVPLSDPHLPDNVLNNWAMEAATAAFSYNFFDYREKLDSLSRYFTPRGHRQLIAAVKNSGNLDAVKEKRLAAYAVAADVPTIIKQGKEGGRHTWRMQVPIKVQYRSSTDSITQDLIVTMKIVRTSTLDSERGIGIQQFVARQWGGKKL